ncbi:hypothetical protein [Caldiplasma sukawensis]
MSFLEITIPPSVPAFLAIFLSLYSFQAEEARKGEFLKNIQIKKEISESLKKHYKDVSDQVDEVKKSMNCFPDKILGDDNLHVMKLNTRYIKRPYPRNVEKAMFHFEAEFNTENPEFLENFKKSEEIVDRLNQKIDDLESRVIKCLQQQNKNSSINVAISFDKRECSDNKINGKEVFRCAYGVWCNKQEYNKEVLEIENYLKSMNKNNTANTRDGSPIIIKSKNWENSQNYSVEWKSSMTLAHVKSRDTGLEIIKLLLKLLKDSNFKEKCESIENCKKEINKNRDEFYKKLEKIKLKINNNELLYVVDCCPFHEEKNYIESVFGKTGLY